MIDKRDLIIEKQKEIIEKLEKVLSIQDEKEKLNNTCSPYKIEKFDDIYTD
jgi:hypothetical protein